MTRSNRCVALTASIMTGLVIISLGCEREPAPSGGLEPTPPRDSQAEATAPPAVDQPADAAPGDATTASFAGVQGPKPEDWVSETPASSMRAAQYRVPGADGAGDAEVAVFAGIMGSNDENIARWVGQFTSPDGTGVEPELSSFDVAGMPITVVYLTGTYSGMSPRGAPTAPQPDTGFLAAIVEGPQTILHIRLLGPEPTVEDRREEFLAFVKGLAPIGSD